VRMGSRTPARQTDQKEGLRKGSARRWAALAARHYTFGGVGKPGLGQLNLILARKIKSSMLAY
jgi:hypothetical protein